MNYKWLPIRLRTIQSKKMWGWFPPGTIKLLEFREDSPISRGWYEDGTKGEEELQPDYWLPFQAIAVPKEVINIKWNPLENAPKDGTVILFKGDFGTMCPAMFDCEDNVWRVAHIGTVAPVGGEIIDISDENFYSPYMWSEY